MSKNENILIELSKLGDTEVVQHCINKGYDINAKNNSGNTPLHIAMKKIDIDMVKLLILNGGKIKAANNDDESPLHYTLFSSVAKKNIPKYFDMISYVINNEKDTLTNLHELLYRQLFDLLEKIYDYSEIDKKVNDFILFLKKANIKCENFVNDFSHTRTCFIINIAKLHIMNKKNMRAEDINKFSLFSIFINSLEDSDYKTTKIVHDLKICNNLDRTINFKGSDDFFLKHICKKITNIIKDKDLDMEEKNIFINMTYQTYMDGYDLNNLVSDRISTMKEDCRKKNKSGSLYYSFYELKDKLCSLTSIMHNTTKHSTVNLLEKKDIELVLDFFDFIKDEGIVKGDYSRVLSESLCKFEEEILESLECHDKVVFNLLSKNTTQAFKI